MRVILSVRIDSQGLDAIFYALSCRERMLESLQTMFRAIVIAAAL